MQIVRALLKEVDGELRFLTGPNGSGTTATLIFFLPGHEKYQSAVSSN
jgi:Fe-S cluster assembly ATPase SufC